MIDTDKYEGHTEGPWITKVNQQVYDKDNNPIATVEYFAQENHSYYNKVLIADAPLLLDAYKDKCEEVKRLEKLLADADLCNVCGLDYAGYADYEESCKCYVDEEVIE